MTSPNSVNKANSAKEQCRVIVVTSGKGGVGKTTTTATLGAALGLLGKRTLVIDADIGLRNLDVILGLESRIVFNLVDVFKEICKPSQATIKSKRSNNLYLLPASQTDDKDVVNEEQFKSVVDCYRREYDFILVDSPAGIEQGFRNASAGCDSSIIVTTPEVSAIRDADRIIGLLAAKGIDCMLVINRLDPELVRRKDMLSVDDVQDILGIDLIGVIERDDDIIVAANKGEPVVYNPKSKSGKSFQEIAKRLCGENIPIKNPTSSSFWQRFIGRHISI
jgi:septum site-determining protein MinD